MNATPVPFAKSPMRAGELPAEMGDLFYDFWAQAAIGLCLADVRGVMIAVNTAFCETVGYSSAELVGSSVIRLLAPEASVRGSVAHAAFMNGDDMAPNGAVYLHKNGRPLYTHATDTRVRSSDGRVFRLTSLIDLDRQTQGASQLRRHQSAENFSALASEISNDFNNLLSIILGYTAFLQDGALEANRLNTAVGGIDHAVRRAANLIKQTLQLSKRDELSFQRVFVGGFVKEFLRMTGETLATGIEVGLDLDAELPPVLLDPQHFHHALANLGQKTRDLIGVGGRMNFSTRRVAGDDVKARFPDARDPFYVVMTVRAQPAASVLAEQEAVGTWEAAVRFAERRRDLAVLVVHNIMASHRGYLEVDAMSGPALVFRLYFPALPEQEPVAEMPVPVDTSGLSTNRTVLVVDDEEMLLHALATTLGRKGFEIIKARDGIEAVELFTANASRIALVLIDLGLPRMSGWEAFMKIKEHSPSVNVLIMSGHLEANLKYEILKAGARGYLQKPFTIKEPWPR